jgi:threonine/homoserine/homoserine lactone efflux protein
MLLKILGIVVVIWLALAVLGAVFEFLGTALVISAVVVVGMLAYSAVKAGRSRRSIGR